MGHVTKGTHLLMGLLSKISLYNIKRTRKREEEEEEEGVDRS